MESRLTAWQVGEMVYAEVLRWEPHVTFLSGIERN